MCILKDLMLYLLTGDTFLWLPIHPFYSFLTASVESCYQYVVKKRNCKSLQTHFISWYDNAGWNFKFISDTHLSLTAHFSTLHLILFLSDVPNSLFLFCLFHSFFPSYHPHPLSPHHHHHPLPVCNQGCKMSGQRKFPHIKRFLGSEWKWPREGKGQVEYSGWGARDEGRAVINMSSAERAPRHWELIPHCSVFHFLL